MHKIRISAVLKEKVPEIELYCIECNISTEPGSDELWTHIQAKKAEIHRLLKVEEISSLPAIRASRKAYKACGKDPARYRLSAEALLRRVVKGDDLYRISNVVDLLNLVSFSSGFSIGGYDACKIQGDVEFGIGTENEEYEGIGRGPLNIEGLPVFRDEIGAFGSPTSDSERTSTEAGTSRFLMVIIDFGAGDLLHETGELAQKLLLEFAAANNIEINIIK